VLGTYGIALAGMDTFFLHNTSLSFSQFLLALIPASGQSVLNINVDNTEFDCGPGGVITSAVIMWTPYASALISNVSIANSKFLGEGLGTNGYGIDMAFTVVALAPITNIQITGNYIGGWGLYGIGARAYSTTPANWIFANNIIQSNNFQNVAGGGGIWFYAGVGAAFSGNVFGGNTSGHQYTGLQLQAGDKISSQGNQFMADLTNPIVFGSIPTNLIISGNRGIDDQEGTVADAATITLPLNPLFTFTGTGTAVTTVAGIWPGRTFTMIPTGASVTFTAGATIGATFSTTTNIPVNGVVDSAGKAWFK
jgi:hypothetical protein